MKKILFSAVILLIGLIPNKGAAQGQEIQQLVLNIEKLAQFKEILRDMKKGYQILSGGYKAVKDISQGNFTLHQRFLDALLQVSPVVRNYKKVGDIAKDQLLLVKESKRGFNRFCKSEGFTIKERAYLEQVYQNLIQESLRNLDELLLILTANKLRMSDEERLEAIDKIYAAMQNKVQFVRNFNGSAAILALQRAKETNDLHTTEGLYELKN
ncbi:TerB family tellurite resistance protein [Flavobacterium sp. JAS]|uniref:TerB family tellurite resistance protein n=1 Tax=Flavobacterium sp. JAS TaxID=2897329 RepID=UPI001E448FDA|nr:TerB family tellurite resistance protein [Flavobacterium sp. JAS]MCD0470602.1 TerB family tellurite resistance protein [Flavobacterium sp. JAS]